MNLLIKVLVLVLVFRGNNASISSVLSDLLISCTTEDVEESIMSPVKGTTDFSLTDYLDSLSITRDGVLDLNQLIQKLNLTSNVDLKSILNSLHVTVLEDGRLDLKSLTQNFNLTNDDIINILSSINVDDISEELLEFANLVKNITSQKNVTEFLNKVTVKNSEDGLLDFKGLAKKYVGTAKEYNVTTSDGYILKIFRIPGNLSKVVVLSHGLLSTSDDFILRGRTSLVYTLVKNGYDVWVINYRGSRYSRGHNLLDPDTDARFWQYSMQEFGYYDLSAVIDFALRATGQKQLNVIGHSEGTSAFFVLMSTRSEYNKKVKVFVALSPVCYLSDSGLALTIGMRLGPKVNNILLAFGIEELLGYQSLARKLIQLLCSHGKFGYDLCVKIGIGAIAGYDPDNLEPDFFTTVLGHVPGGTSRKNIIHYTQVGNNDRFAQYDYGTNNSEIYGSESPPKYNLQEVTCPVSLFVGQNDKIVGLKDAERVRRELPNVVGYHVVKGKWFNHVDFLYGFNAIKVVYRHVMCTLDEYN